MKCLNKVQLIGNVGNVPKTIKLNNGTICCTFSLATHTKRQNKETLEFNIKTEWHQISVFSSYIIEILKKFVQKGTALYVEGELETRKFINKEGIKNFFTEVVIKDFSGQIIVLENDKSDIP